jgi:hypothetical protein
MDTFFPSPEHNTLVFTSLEHNIGLYPEIWPVSLNTRFGENFFPSVSITFAFLVVRYHISFRSDNYFDFAVVVIALLFVFLLHCVAGTSGTDWSWAQPSGRNNVQEFFFSYEPGR